MKASVIFVLSVSIILMLLTQGCDSGYSRNSYQQEYGKPPDQVIVHKCESDSSWSDLYNMMREEQARRNRQEFEDTLDSFENTFGEGMRMIGDLQELQRRQGRMIRRHRPR